MRTITIFIDEFLILKIDNEGDYLGGNDLELIKLAVSNANNVHISRITVKHGS